MHAHSVAPRVRLACWHLGHRRQPPPPASANHEPLACPPLPPLRLAAPRPALPFSSAPSLVATVLPSIWPNGLERRSSSGGGVLGGALWRAESCEAEVETDPSSRVARKGQRRLLLRPLEAPRGLRWPLALALSRISWSSRDGQPPRCVPLWSSRRLCLPLHCIFPRCHPCCRVLLLRSSLSGCQFPVHCKLDPRLRGMRHRISITSLRFRNRWKP